MGAIFDAIHDKLTAAFAPTRLEIQDDSARHAGHAGASAAGESHFNVVIESQAFEGAPKVARQRMVYRTLAEELAGTAARPLGEGPRPRRRLTTKTKPVAGQSAIALGEACLKTTITVNGQARALDLDTRTTLLDALREHLDLKGSKKGCDHGQCGACTVLANGVRINACLSLAVMHDGDEITTIEGIGSEENLHPLQVAFLTEDAFQCGYCTPGQICSAVGMLKEAAEGWPSQATPDLNAAIALTDAEIRERMSGNICRCSAYPQILAAIRDVAGEVA